VWVTPFFTMENSLSQLVVDQHIERYRAQPDIHDFFDIFGDTISQERITKELTENAHVYYNNATLARNSLIKRELQEKNLYVNARNAYAHETCDKVLLHFRKTVFIWSQGGKKYADPFKGIHEYDELPQKYINELYNLDVVTDLEELRGLLDAVNTKIHEEFQAYETVRACAYFYRRKPVIGKHPAIHNGCLNYIVDLLQYTRDAGINEIYFQSAAQNLRQYREMLDPEKETPEDFKILLSLCTKTSSEVRNDIREALVQYITVIALFQDMQAKTTKADAVKVIEDFIKETGYKLEELGYSVEPLYKNSLDHIMFKKSGWELKAIPAKK